MTGHFADQFRIVINSHSGSVPEDGGEQIANELSDLGLENRIEGIFDLNAAPLPPPTHRTEAIIVWGGDGTVASILSDPQYRETPVLALPGGTMNLLHKFLHGEDCQWQQCLKHGLEEGRLVDLPAGEVDGKRFFVGGLFGHLSEMAQPREALRNGDVLEAAKLLAAGSHLEMDDVLEISFPGQKVSLLTSPVAVGAFLPRNGSPKHLDFGALQASSLVDLTQFALEAMVRDWRDTANVDHFSVDRFDVIGTTRKQSTLPATLDGELHELPLPFSVRIIPEAAKVIATS